ncbi:Gfo/Idh/MocA family protein [Paenibacillus flagellatus]|nr:Gfo/Idh/MocA family oxidoreductase [Paenibacillus flagellatus]
MKPIGFGIVGCGFFGGEFARLLQEMEGARVAAVQGGSGKSARAVAEEIGCGFEERLEDLVRRDDVDAIVVASPNHLHREPVLLAARHGKHVFCEKPVALSNEDCRDMTEACRSAGVRFMAGHILHFFDGIERVKRWIREGVIGRPIAIHSERTGWEEPKPDVSWKKNERESGGHLFHHIHELELMLALMGAPAELYMAGDNVAHRGPGFGDEDDVLLLTLRFANGGFGTLQTGSGFRWGEHYMKINGTEGAIRIDFRRSAVELRKPGERTVSFGLHDEPLDNEERIRIYEVMDGGVIYGDPQKRPPAFLQTAMRREMRCFLDAIGGKPIEDDKRALFDGTGALLSIATASAAMSSRRSGVPQQVPIVPDR